LIRDSDIHIRSLHLESGLAVIAREVRLCAVAEFERDLIRERTLAGLVAARKRGARLGRPRSIDQYRSQVLELKGRGMSRRAIAGELGIPASNVGRLLAKAA
jgi:DNA invertase Pin-like site-specific DNA recombinase